MPEQRVLTQSEAIWQDAQHYIPWGTNLLARHPLRYVNGVYPKFAAKAKGCYLWDVDGNRYVDFAMGHGPFLLGYADDTVDTAVIEQIKNGTVYTFMHPLETEVARLLVDTIPCAEMVRFAKTGGEADAIAIRVSRGHTGRDKVLFCGYHGWHDWYLSANLLDSAALNAGLVPGISTRGVPRGLAGTCIPFEYNNIDSLKRALEANRGQVAAVIMEPCRGWLPTDGFLEKVRDLTANENVLLIFDEVVTGFRFAPGGAQEHFGVTPDMAVFGKAMANGYPQAAIVGRREIMASIDDMFISSMFWGDTIGLAAAKANLHEIANRDAITNVWKKGEYYQRRVRELAQKFDVPYHLQGLPPVSYIKFDHEDPTTARQLNLLFMQEMIERGFIVAGLFYFCDAHTDQIIDDSLAATEEVLAIIQDAMQKGDIAARLRNQGYLDGFRRMV